MTVPSSSTPIRSAPAFAVGKARGRLSQVPIVNIRRELGCQMSFGTKRSAPLDESDLDVGLAVASGRKDEPHGHI